MNNIHNLPENQPSFARDFSEMEAFDRAAEQSLPPPKQMEAPQEIEPFAPPKEVAQELTERAKELCLKMRPIGELQPALSNRNLVKQWLDRGTTSVVFGESNVGKTFFALDVAMHVAAGFPWCGNRVFQNAAPVFFLAAEGGVGINNRLAALRQKKPKLFTKAQGNMTILPTTIDLKGSVDAEAICDAISDKSNNGASLIVIDTLARSMGIGDENSSQDMGAVIRNIDKIRETIGAHVMVVHHSGKDTSKGARGSGSLRAAVDTEIELTVEQNVIAATQLKQRDMAKGKDFHYRLETIEIGHDEDGDRVTSAVIQATEPVKKRIRLKGKNLVAMQALEGAIKEHGAVKRSSEYPASRQCVSVEKWKEYCRKHGLADSDTPAAFRTAFSRAKAALNDAGAIRIFEDYLWRTEA